MICIFWIWDYIEISFSPFYLIIIEYYICCRPENKGYLSMVMIFSLLILGLSRGPVLKSSTAMFVNLSLVFVYLYRSAAGTLIFPLRQILSVKLVPSSLIDCCNLKYHKIGVHLKNWSFKKYCVLCLGIFLNTYRL